MDWWETAERGDRNEAPGRSWPPEASAAGRIAHLPKLAWTDRVGVPDVSPLSAWIVAPSRLV